MTFQRIALSLSLLVTSSLSAQFTPGPYIPKPSERVIDVNGDGLDDLLSFDYQTAVHTLHINEGGSVFGPEIVIDDSLIRGERVFAAGDLSGDGNGDLVVAGPYDANDQRDLRVLHGDGRGRFTEVQKIDNVGWILLPVEVNGDKRPDLLATRDEWSEWPPYSTVQPLLSQPDGTLAPSAPLILEWPVHYATAGDFNGDGLGDLALGSYDGLYIATGAANGAFNAPVLQYLKDYIRETVSADYDEDGHLDVALHEVHADAMHTVTVLFGSGTGTFERSARFDLGRGSDPWDSRPQAKQVLTGNFSGDARPEIVATRHDGTVHTLRVVSDGLEEVARTFMEPWLVVRPATVRPGSYDLFVEWTRNGQRGAAVWYSVP